MGFRRQDSFMTLSGLLKGVIPGGLPAKAETPSLNPKPASQQKQSPGARGARARASGRPG